MRKTAIALAALSAAAMLAGCAATGPAAAGPAARGQRAAASQRAATSKDGSARVTARTASAGSASGSAGAGSCNPYASLSPEPGGPAVTGGSFAAKIRKQGFLIAGVDQTTYHFGYLNPLDGQIEGFDIDMIKDVAAAIFGISPASSAIASRVHFKAISDVDRIKDVQDGTVDIVAHTMTVNCARQQQVDFSTIYYDASAQILVDKPAGGGTAPTLARLGQQHARVCATSGSDDLAIIARAHATPVPETYWTDCLVLLEEGQVAGIVTDNSILYGMQAQDPDTVVTGPALEAEPYGLAISKAHPDFVRFVNAVLARAVADGQWLASCRQWVASTCQRPGWPIDYVS
ncbi:MAG TPA: transporter substrate-binding domain-containing protein [Trebonia sp.]|nr:transporter substrate-binding domain-containing protein [Trebonia sp.]